VQLWLRAKFGFYLTLKLPVASIPSRLGLTNFNWYKDYLGYLKQTACAQQSCLQFWGYKYLSGLCSGL